MTRNGGAGRGRHFCKHENLHDGSSIRVVGGTNWEGSVHTPCVTLNCEEHNNQRHSLNNHSHKHRRCGENARVSELSGEAHTGTAVGTPLCTRFNLSDMELRASSKCSAVANACLVAGQYSNVKIAQVVDDAATEVVLSGAAGGEVKGNEAVLRCVWEGHGCGRW